jgi:hypothetical protein
VPYYNPLSARRWKISNHYIGDRDGLFVDIQADIKRARLVHG